MSDNTESKPHPWDIKQVERGFQLTHSELEVITQTKYGTNEHNLAVLELKRRLEQELKEEGRDWMVRCLNGLRVLTNLEQSEHANHKSDKANKVQIAMVDKMAAVDITDFTAEQVEAHTRRSMLVNIRAAQAKKARKVTKTFIAKAACTLLGNTKVKKGK